jgi:hypothetical protein
VIELTAVEAALCGSDITVKLGAVPALHICDSAEADFVVTGAAR